MLLVLFVLLNMFIAILAEAYEKAKIEVFGDTYYAQVVLFTAFHSGNGGVENGGLMVAIIASLSLCAYMLPVYSPVPPCAQP